jgi:hydroxyacylglutathione hydrolase
MIDVIPIPAFKDNYIWLICAGGAGSSSPSNIAVVIDPGDAQVVLATLKQRNLQLGAILVTHHHWDHVTGIETLRQHFQTTAVYGPRNSPIKTITHRLKEGDSIDLPGNLGRCNILETPGHTLDHINYLIENHLFCGDTLFSAGCGRLFEGSPGQMLTSLNKLAKLPTNTYIYPAHEYTYANLQFAIEIDANNPAIIEHIEQVKQLRNKNLPSLPSTMAKELETNVFLRCADPRIKERVEQHAKRKLSTPLEVFTELRLWKDNY